MILVLCFFITPYAYAEKKLIPGGEVIGISIKSEGLLITGTMDISDENGKTINPGEYSDIKPGDRIILIDGISVTSSEQLINYVKNKTSNVVLTLKRDRKNINATLKPVLSGESYKLGIKVKEGASGIGTLTFIDPETKAFGALGHGISDLDTNTLIKCKKGNLLTCSLSEPKKGKKGAPGELNGSLENIVLGTFYNNTPNGLFGQIENIEYFGEKKEIPTGDFSDIKEGHAYILSDLAGNGICQYRINIKKAQKGNLDGKNIVFEVTDEELITKTGGIVQGMSGSPIVQNGKLIGAVTHVFVNDPTRGYGIFIENMISEAEIK